MMNGIERKDIHHQRNSAIHRSVLEQSAARGQEQRQTKRDAQNKGRSTRKGRHIQRFLGCR
jgi:hypothetical protein